MLYRTNAQADVLASALRAAGIPYRMHAHADLFGERVVRDLIALFAARPTTRLIGQHSAESPIGRGEGSGGCRRRHWRSRLR